MKRILILTAAFGLLVSTGAQGQDRLQFGGLVYNHDLMMSTDYAQLSQPHIFGTARVMGMGGAFTSLGADLSSMSINPAGLGMYQRSEFSITPLLIVSNGSTAGTQPWVGDSKTRFGFANVGAAINVYENASASITSITIGFGLNRIADFNARYSYSSESRYNPSNPNALMPTVADVFGQQLGQDGIFPNSSGNLGYDGLNPWYWPAVLGYNGYMISANNNEWVPDGIGHNASVLHSVDVRSYGSINEFAMSMGANMNNIVYWGATLGIQSVHRKQGFTYQEEYGYFNTNGIAVDKNGTNLTSQLDYANLYQQSVLDGSGVNLKVGVIVRPIPSLRIGMAFHTPTYYSLTRSYYGEIASKFTNNTTSASQVNHDQTPHQKDNENDSWDFVSPSRLMFGISYTLGKFAIFSVDYERDWYNGIRVKHTPNGADISKEAYKQEFKNNYQGNNTLRAGIEVRPLPVLALRVGGGFSDSMFKNKELYYNTPTTYLTRYLSAGLGITFSRSVSLDVSYQYVSQKQTPYQLFFSQYATSGSMMTYSGLYDTKLKRHYIGTTLNVRF